MGGRDGGVDATKENLRSFLGTEGGRKKQDSPRHPLSSRDHEGTISSVWSGAIKAETTTKKHFSETETQRWKGLCFKKE